MTFLLPNVTMPFLPCMIYLQTLAFPYECRSQDFPTEFYPYFIFTGPTPLLNKFLLPLYTLPVMRDVLL